jgi:hypothetical protein
MVITPAKLIAEYGQHFKEGTITTQNLHKQIFVPSETKVLFSPKPTKNTRIDNINTSLTQVLQPFHAKFSHLGSLDFDPNPFNLDRVKINVSMKPDDLAATALDFWVQKGVDRTQAPIVAQISEFLIAKAQEDDETITTFFGVKSLPANASTGVAGTPLMARDGLRKILRDYNTAGAFAPLSSTIAMGAVPTDPILFVDYIETFYYSIPEKYRKFIKKIVMSRTLETRFKRGMRKKYDVNYDQTGDKKSYIIDTMCQVVGVMSQEGSPLIWTTVEGNAVGFIKGAENQNVFDLEKHEIYNVLFATDWYEGYNFINPAWVWNNGQDLA